MAQTVGINQSEIDANAIYAQSFGALANKTPYYNPHIGAKGIGMDIRKDMFDHMATQIGMKAQLTTAGGAGTAGYAMIPVFVDPLVIDQTRKYTPLVEMIPRVSNNGIYADYNVITAKGGGFTRQEGGALVETDTTYARRSTAIKYLYAVGAVTGQTLAAQPSYTLSGFNPNGSTPVTGGFANAAASNAKQMKVLEKTREIKELEEDLIINGNATTSYRAGDPNGTEFDGIITLMSSTNTVDKNTSALQLSDYNRAVRYAFDDGGRPNLAVCSSGVYEDTENLLLQKFGYMQPTKEILWGFNTIVLKTMVGDIPLVPSMFMSNTSGSKAVYLLDMTVVEMRVLQDLTYFDLAKTNDSDRFALKIYEALIIRNTSFCASITEISA